MNVTLPALLACALLCSASAAAAADRVDAEASRTPPATKVLWRAPAGIDAPIGRLRYADLGVSRIVALHEANERSEGRTAKATQIGIGRTASSESARKRLPPLQWQALPGGGSVARFEVTSPVALGLRVGLRIEGLPTDAELRFQGSELPLGDVLSVDAREVTDSTPKDGLYWTPATDGETQAIEVWLPPGRSPNGVRIAAPELSHLLTNPRRDFKIVEKIGESGSCNIDTACRVAELGEAFAHAKNAVAHMVFNLYRDNGTVFGSYICTGTLLNDTVPGTQVPYFYTANHCFAGGGNDPDDPPVQDMQKVATSLNTHWNYEATACGSGTSTARTLLDGGADLLFNDPDTDAMLLRLRKPAPSFATFAGWDASMMANNSDVVAIHHPAGDAKKVSFGRQIPASTDAVNYGVGWLQGTTEGGSSGSGLFTVDANGRYRLRGGLYGGNASCANTGSLSNPQNRDWYSRLDVVFPQVRQYLAPQPARANGSQPLLPN